MGWSIGRKGVTLVEFLTATAIVILAVGSVVAVHVMSTTAWKEGNTEIALQRQASIAMEKMMRGVRGIDGIREADSVTLISSNVLEYTSAIDLVERSFYLSGTDLMYDPDTTIASNEYSIAENLTTTPPGLIFSLNANEDIVTIELSMSDRVRDRVINASLTGHVKLRN